MFTYKSLFWSRFIHNAKLQKKAWGSVLDWSVWLYIVLPAGFILSGLYREAWREQPEWLNGIPWLTLYPLAMLALFFLGGVRSFIHEGDRLFLIQRPAWLEALRLRGIAYSALFKSVILLIPFLLLFPFLVKIEGLSLVQLTLAYVFTVFMSLIFNFGMHDLKGRLRGWRKWTAESIFFLLLAGSYLFLIMTASNDTNKLFYCCVGAGLLLAVLLLISIRSKLDFEYEVQNEAAAQMRSTELLMSQVIPTRPAFRFKKPLFFRRSQRIFHAFKPAEALAELKIKAFVRNQSQLRIWLSLASLGSYAVSLSSPFVALVPAAALTYLANSWLKLQWQHWLSDEFIASFKWSESDIQQAMKLSRLWMLLPLVVLWSAIAAYKLLQALI